MAVKKRLTASALVKTGYSKLVGYLVGTDGATDAIITIYDSTAATAGTEAVPTQKFDASALGLNGAWFGHEGAIECQVGIYVEITDIGTGELLVYYN